VRIWSREEATVCRYEIYGTVRCVQVLYGDEVALRVGFVRGTEVQLQDIGKFDEPEELINFFTAQFTASDKSWVGDMLQDEEKYVEWQRRQQSLSYNFEQDLNKLAEEADAFDDLLKIQEGNYPLVIEKFLQDEISLETVVILDQLTRFMRRADRAITETIVWPDLSKRIRKYGLLLRFDKNRMRQIVIRMFTS
jgi:hypothetical protein